MGDSMGLEAPLILGAGVSGVVEDVGPGVSEFSPGDEVYYTPEVFGPGSNGGYAEYHLAPEYLVAKKPAPLSHEEAAVVPLAGGTAHEALIGRLDVKVGETVLIHGGAGGVGAFAIQIAKSAGARVLATAPIRDANIASAGTSVRRIIAPESSTSQPVFTERFVDTRAGEPALRSLRAAPNPGVRCR